MLYLPPPPTNAGYKAYNQMRRFVKENASDEVPVHLRNAPTKLMKGWATDANTATPDEPNAYAVGGYADGGRTGLYQPVPRGLEIKIGEKLAWLKSLDEEALKAK